MLRKALYASIVFTICCALTALFMCIFWCGTNPSLHFELNSHCSFWDQNLFLGDWIMNMLSDIIILLLPFPLLLRLELNRGQIIGLCVTFGLGAITIIVSVFRYVTVKQHSFLPLCKFSAKISVQHVALVLTCLRCLVGGRNKHWHDGCLATSAEAFAAQSRQCGDDGCQETSLDIHSNPENAPKRKEPGATKLFES
jgi:hypothetical protein